MQESRVEKGMVPLTVTPSGPLGTFLLPVPVTLSSSGLDALVLGGAALRPGDNNKQSIRLKLGASPWPLWASDALQPKHDSVRKSD